MTQTATRTDRLKAAHDKLTDAVESIVSGDDWQRMLKVASKFHRYSFNNHLMIFLQRPEATYVAGFRKWQELNRFVRKGEKGIAIFAPCKYRTKIETDDGDEKTLSQLRGFRVAHVFDISQTDGDPLKDLDAVKPQLLDGDAPKGLWDSLVAQASAAGFEVTREKRGSANGFCDFVAKRIAVRPDVSDLQAVKTLVHELAHALLHAEERPRSMEIAEVEVESVAFIVLDALGLASGTYSFPYVARWSGGDVDLVKQSAERVVGCSRSILGILNQRS